MLLITVVFYWPNLSVAAGTHFNNEKNYFQFVISKYHTSRQGGQTLNVYVRYAYKPNLPASDYPDYRELRKQVMNYLEPNDKFPAEVFWEVLATDMGHELMQNFPISGISVQIEVLDNLDPNAFEPGDHGPVFTMGDILPLDIHH